MRALLTLSLLVCLSVVALADEPPLAERVDALIARLGAEAPADGEAALRELFAIGEPARKPLLAVREGASPPLRGRLARLLRLLERPAGAFEFALVAPAKLEAAERARKAREPKEGQRYLPPRGHIWAPVAPQAQRGAVSERLLVVSDPRWDLTAIKALRTARDPHTQQLVPMFRIAPGRAAAFHAFTKQHLDRELAIVAFGRVIAAPRIMSPLREEGMISGLDPVAEVPALQRIIRALKQGGADPK